jgi:4-hydroxythreonine-4-phosphate dehydrogenase
MIKGLTFKTLSFGNGVNYTAGLNKIRTSPDHGTALQEKGQINFLKKRFILL